MPIAAPQPSAPRRIRTLLFTGLGMAFRFICGAVILLDELVRPLYRPLVEWVAALRLIKAFEAWVGGLSSYAVLALIVVPYAIVEPLKFLALFAIADGHLWTGTTVLILAYLASFVVIERIYSAGREKLMQLRPIAWIIETAGAVHRQLFAYLRIEEIKARMRVLWRWARLRAR